MDERLIAPLATHSAKATYRAKAETRGHVAHLMGQHRLYREYPVAALNAWIEVPISLGQIQVFFDASFGEAVGYVTWAYLSAEVERRWLSDPDMLLHFSEWNEGERLWIMDFVAPYGHAYDMARYLQRSMFPGHAQACSLRRAEDGSVIKRSRWRPPPAARAGA